MTRISARVGIVLACMALSGCEGPRPEIDQIAQSSLIGLSKKKILACLGSPARRMPVGTEEIWEYRIGQTRTEGGLPAWEFNDPAAPFNPSHQCNVDIVIDKYGVSQVYYSKPDGGHLPLGQQCLYEIRPCVDP